MRSKLVVELDLPVEPLGNGLDHPVAFGNAPQMVGVVTGGDLVAEFRVVEGRRLDPQGAGDPFFCQLLLEVEEQNFEAGPCKQS